MGAEPARRDSEVFTRRMRAFPRGRELGWSGPTNSSEVRSVDVDVV